MKIVINSCFGGFSLSPKGERRYLELKGLNSYFYKKTAYKFNDGKTEFTRIDNIDDVPRIFFYCTTYDLNLSHLKIQSVDLGEWDDDLPINKFNCPEAEFKKYFKEN